MKILITGTTGNSMPPPYAGIPKLVLMTARKWREAGHEVGLTFTYRPKHPDDLGADGTYFFEYSSRPGKLAKLLFLVRYFLRNPILYFGLLAEYRAICPHFSREMVLYAAYGVYLDTVVASFKPDIVLGEAVLVKSFMAAAVANRRGVPIAFDVYAEVRDLSMGENRHLDENERKIYWESFLNRADLVIGLDNCSVEMKGYLPEEKLKVFWDTCDYEFFSQDIPLSRNELREYFKLPQSTFLAGAVGSFELRKGHDHLIRAVAQLVKEGLDVGVAICGSLGGTIQWRAVAEEAGIADHVYFFTSLSELEVAKLHRAMDLYTNLSNTQRSCSLDLALLEAMASGLPVLVYDTGALPKAVPGGLNGRVVPTNEVRKAADAIRELYELSPEERQEMGRISSSIASKVDIGITAAIKAGWFEEIVRAREKPRST